MKKMVPDFLKGDYAFIFLFLIYYGLFYVCTRLLTAMAMPHSLYHVDFFAEHNIISGWRNSMLNISSWILNKGFRPTYISGHTLCVAGGARIGLGIACLGIDVLRFWWAIVLAYPQKTRLKLEYFFVGTVGFLILNIARFTILAIVYTNSMGTRFRNVDHHFIFNCITYLVLFLFLFKWLKHPILKPDAGGAAVAKESLG